MFGRCVNCHGSLAQKFNRRWLGHAGAGSGSLWFCATECMVEWDRRNEEDLPDEEQSIGDQILDGILMIADPEDHEDILYEANQEQMFGNLWI